MPNTAFFLNLARIKLCCTEIFESKCIELVWHGIQLGGTADHWIQALRLSFTAGTLRYWCLLERQPRNVIEIRFIIFEFWKEGGLVRCLCCFVRSVCVVSAYLSDWLLIIEPQVTSSICAPVVALLSYWIKSASYAVQKYSNGPLDCLYKWPYLGSFGQCGYSVQKVASQQKGFSMDCCNSGHFRHIKAALFYTFTII